MELLYQSLIEDVKDLPFDKILQIKSYVRFVKQEYKEDVDDDLYVSPEDEAYLYDILENGEFVSDAEVLAMIERMPDDENL
ncbi:MAG: hypothetical protein FWG64_03870 [Firmicutes bacterium]|nr:hypothetical protein [Bacillota bacterium]